jgi:hypothetical protein
MICPFDEKNKKDGTIGCEQLAEYQLFNLVFRLKRQLVAKNSLGEVDRADVAVVNPKREKAPRLTGSHSLFSQLMHEKRKDAPKAKRPTKPKWSKMGADAEFPWELYRTGAVTRDDAPKSVHVKYPQFQKYDLANFRINLHSIREEVELETVAEMDGKFMINSVELLC